MFFTWVRSRNSALIVGLVSVAIATAFMAFGEFYNKTNLIDAAQWLASIGIAITSLGIAAHSIIISKESDKKLLALANKSDEKMKSVATTTFLDIADRFEQLKCLIIGIPVDNKGKIVAPGIWPSTGRSYYIWKCKELVRGSVELSKHVDPKFHEQLARYYMGLLEGLRKKQKTITDTERNDIRGMHNLIKKLKIDDKYKAYPTDIVEPPKQKESGKK